VRSNQRREPLGGLLEGIRQTAHFLEAARRRPIKAPALAQDPGGREAELGGGGKYLRLLTLDQVGAGLGMLTVLEPADRVHTPADPIARLDDGDLGAGTFESPRRGESGEPGTGHDYPDTGHRMSISSQSGFAGSGVRGFADRGVAGRCGRSRTREPANREPAILLYCGSMKPGRESELADAFDLVTRVGLGLPGVELAAKYDGSPVLKVGGAFMAGLAMHPSAEPDTLVVRARVEDRELLLEEAPETYYVTDYYAKHPVVLARLARLDRGALRDLLAVSYRLTLAKSKRGRDAVAAFADRGPRTASLRTDTRSSRLETRTPRPR